MTISFNKWLGGALAVLAGVAIIIGILWPPGLYMKCDPPPDVDKNDDNVEEKNACWIAAAANMLAAAGYGGSLDTNAQETDIQIRAEQIYKEMLELFCGCKPGWVERALLDWLDFDGNVVQNYYVPTKTYGLVTPDVGDPAEHRNPWIDADGPMIIANHLRHCDFAAVNILWPWEGDGGIGGHWLTCWGDERSGLFLLFNPDTLRVTDSDFDKDGDVQTYSYDDYNDPNPDGDNAGKGWYIDYEVEGATGWQKNHPFIRQVVIFMRTNQATLASHVPISVGSYRIHPLQNLEAISLHYELSTEADILNVVTVVDEANLERYEAQDLKEQQRLYIMDWDFKKEPLPLDQPVTITTELALPNKTGMRYKNVHFSTSNNGDKLMLPDIGWTITPEEIPKEKIEHFALGGYVIGSFDVFAESGNPSTMRPLAQYRLIHQYRYSQSPSLHKFTLNGTKGFYIANMRFGHSYGFLEGKALWEFDKWKPPVRTKTRALEDRPIEISLDFGPMPYPTVDESPSNIPIK